MFSYSSTFVCLLCNIAGIQIISHSLSAQSPTDIMISVTHPSRHSSISLKCLKKALNKLKPCVRSAVPITSRQECIESCGIPKSTVRIPVSALIIGPIVVPQGQSDLTTNSCIGILSFAFLAISRAMKPVTPLVASLMI